MTAVDERTPESRPRARSLASAAVEAVVTSVQNRPLASFAAAFALGIVAVSPISSWAIWPCLVLLVVSLALFLTKGDLRIVAVVSILALGVACGGLRYLSTRAVPLDDVSHVASGPGEEGRAVTVVGTIRTDPEPKPGRVSFVLQATSIQARTDRFDPASGQLYVTVRTSAIGDYRHLDYGDVVSLHGLLEQPKLHTNPGAFSFRVYQSRRGSYCLLNVKRSTGVDVVGHGGWNPVLALSWRVRQSIVNTVEAHQPSTEAAILEGILIGRRATLPPDLSDDFVKTGTVHVLASAGLHVGIVLWWIWQVFNRLTLHRKVTAGGLIGFLIIYTIVCGGRPSVTRAAIMAIVYLGALLFEREPDVPTALGLAALIILIGSPYAILEPGFALSFLTVITLAVSMPIWDALFRGRIDQLKLPSRGRKAVQFAVDLVGLTLFAQLGSMPVVAFAYNETSIAGLLANLIIVPLLFVVIPLGLASVVVGRAPGLGVLMFKFTLALVLGIEVVVRWLGQSTLGSMPISTPSVWIVAGYYGLVWGAAAYVRRRLPGTLIPGPSP